MTHSVSRQLLLLCQTALWSNLFSSEVPFTSFQTDFEKRWHFWLDCESDCNGNGIQTPEKLSRLLHAILYNFTHFKSELRLERWHWQATCIKNSFSVESDDQPAVERALSSLGRSVCNGTHCYSLISLLIKVRDWERMNRVLCWSEKQTDFRDALTNRESEYVLKCIVLLSCNVIHTRGPVYYNLYKHLTESIHKEPMNMH